MVRGKMVTGKMVPEKMARKKWIIMSSYNNVIVKMSEQSIK